jgi:hypothetical protein
MVQLAIFGNPVEAELTRARLEAEGIRAVIIGSGSGDVFAGMGIGLSNVQILVPEEDLRRATDLLDDDEDEDEGGPAVTRKPRRKPPSTQVRPPIESALQGSAPTPDSPAPESSDLPPEEEMPPAEDDEREDRSVTWTADDVATRAFRATIFGFLTFGVLHVYALWLVARLPWAEGELSHTGWRKAVAAAVISVVPASLLILFCLGVVVQAVVALLR